MTTTSNYRLGEPARRGHHMQRQGHPLILQTAEASTNEKTTSTTESMPTLGPDSPITNLYLTFNTPLPVPNTTILPRSLTTTTTAAEPPPPPPQPSLLPFIDPHKWPSHRKTYHLVLSCLATFLTAYTAGSYSTPSSIMASYFHTSTTAVLCGITTFCTGFALAPMVLAPFSEIQGRYPVFAVSGVIFVLFQLVCGLIPSTSGGLAGMLVSRFMVGVGGSVFSTMIGGVIADLWEAQGRNTPMAIFSGSVLCGTGAGPLVSSVITYRLGDDGEAWKWVFWHQVIMGAAMMILLVVFFKESRGSVVLSRRAEALNKWYAEREAAGYYGVWMHDSGVVGQSEPSDDDTVVEGASDEEKKTTAGPSPAARSGSTTSAKLVRLRWRVKSDEERSSIGKMISISVYRPFHLLVTEPVVFFFSLWVSFAWAVLYLTFASIPYVFRTVYDFNMEQCGYVFAAMIVGAALSTIIGIWQDELLKNPQWRAENWPNSDASSSDEDETQRPTTRTSKLYTFLRRRFPVETPESRLYFTCITATLLPIGLFMFGFTTSSPSTAAHWIAPAIAIALATMGIFSVYLATFNYLADVYHMYASSALAAQSCCRNVLGGIFPLVTLPMFQGLGNAGAGGLLGGLAMGLTLVPWVLVIYGRRIRRRSKFAVVSSLSRLTSVG